jgi:MFS family permease
MRLFFSSLSDRIGREQTLFIGCIFLITSMILLALAKTQLSYTIAAGVFGLATGVSSPTLFAWTADLSLPERRGTGSGTMFIALEAGILFGSGMTFIFYNNTLQSAQVLFYIAAAFALVALLTLVFQIKRKRLIGADSDIASLNNAPNKSMGSAK